MVLLEMVDRDVLQIAQISGPTVGTLAARERAFHPEAFAGGKHGLCAVVAVSAQPGAASRGSAAMGDATEWPSSAVRQEVYTGRVAGRNLGVVGPGESIR